MSFICVGIPAILELAHNKTVKKYIKKFKIEHFSTSHMIVSFRCMLKSGKKWSILCFRKKKRKACSEQANSGHYACGTNLEGWNLYSTM